MQYHQYLSRLVAGVALLALLAGCGVQEEDPVAAEFPIAYIKRPLFDADGDPNDIFGSTRDPFVFTAGSDLFMRDRASPRSQETNISFPITQGQGDVSDPEVSYDGTKILFSAHAPMIPGADPEDQPTWNIWEYDIPSKTLRRIIHLDPAATLDQDLIAQGGDDIDPIYLPDGRILFSSNRQRRSIELLTNSGQGVFQSLDEDRRQPAVVLHVMESSVTSPNDIHQISFNQSNDHDPSMLRNGKVVFSRWDHMGGVNDYNIYTSNPDGTALALLYGAHSHSYVVNETLTIAPQFFNPREMEDGRLLVNVMARNGAIDRGDMVIIDTANFVDSNQPKLFALGGTAQAQTWVTTTMWSTTPPATGRYAGVSPMNDGTNRLLASWSPCRLLEAGVIVECTPARLASPTVVEADPYYGLYIRDLTQDTYLPVLLPTAGTAITDPLVVVARPVPTDIPATTPNASLASLGLGLINVRSVYDTYDTVPIPVPVNPVTPRATIGMRTADLLPTETWPTVQATDPATGVLTMVADVATLANPAATTAAQRPARFVRVVQAVPTPPDQDNNKIGNGTHEMRQIVGYAPIEPDGSLQVEVPADVPLALEVVDARGRKFTTHTNWLQVKAGEVVTCNGCHSARDGRPALHGGPSVSGYPNTAFLANGVPQAPLVGETMAEMRARLTCPGLACARTPTFSLVYEDVWTDPAVRAKDASYTLSYATLAAAEKPVGATCEASWSSTCRAVINYAQHIHPAPPFTGLSLWAKPRQVLDGAGAVIADNTCTLCHNRVNAAGAAMVPAGQLDLSDGASDVAVRLKSYAQLLTGRPALELNAMGVLVPMLESHQVVVGGVPQTQQLVINGVVQVQTDAAGAPVIVNGATVPLLVPVYDGPTSNTVALIILGIPQVQTTLDGNGNYITLLDAAGQSIPITVGEPATVNAPATVSALSTRRSYFMEKMLNQELLAGRALTGATNHAGMMSDAELKLLTEWIDLGAHYANTPGLVLQD